MWVLRPTQGRGADGAWDCLRKGKVRAAVHHHHTKPWRDAAKAEQASVKANAEYLYQKALHDDPALAASNPVSRFLQKQRIKRNYAKELRQAEKTAKNTAATAKSAAQKAKDAFKETFSTSSTIAGRCCW